MQRKIKNLINKFEEEKEFAIKQVDYWCKINQQCCGIWQGRQFAFTEVIEKLNKLLKTKKN